MKKYLIGSIVGAIIITAWSFLGYFVLGIQDDSMKYSSAQESIMSTLTANLKEDGAYMIPNAPTKKEQQELMNHIDGKPMAQIIYKAAAVGGMTARTIRSFLVDIFLVVSLIYMLTRAGTPTGMRVFSASVAFGLAAWLWTFYLGHVWGVLPWSMIKGELIYGLVAWGVVGLWLAWFLNRTKTVS